MGNAFIAGYHVVSASHLVRRGAYVHFGDEQRFIEFRIWGDETRGQDLAISRDPVENQGFQIVSSRPRVGEEVTAMGHDNSGLFRISARVVKHIKKCSFVNTSDREMEFQFGMSGCVLLNSHGEAIGPLPRGNERIAVVEHISGLKQFFS